KACAGGRVPLPTRTCARCRCGSATTAASLTPVVRSTWSIGRRARTPPPSRSIGWTMAGRTGPRTPLPGRPGPKPRPGRCRPAKTCARAGCSLTWRDEPGERPLRQVVRGVWQLAGFPRDMFNVYLMEDVLVDAATRWAFTRILRQLGKRRPSLVALTHCHPD